MAQNRHFIALHPHKLLYGRIPKVANSAVKGALAKTVAHNPVDKLIPTNDAYWVRATGDDTALVTSERAAQLADDYFSFAFVRDPIDRAVSCFANKFMRNKSDIPAALRDAGFRKDMSIGEFVKLVAQTTDEDLDVHIRPQSAMLSHGDRLIPEFIGYYESLDNDWKKLIDHIRGSREINLPDRLPKKNETGDALKAEARSQLTAPDLDILRRRYQRDYQMFYRTG